MLPGAILRRGQHLETDRLSVFRRDMRNTRTKRTARSNALPRLGELELALLEVLWRRGDGTARQLVDELPVHLRTGLNTVQSTLERLYRKEFLAREKVGHAYAYRARLTRSQLLGRLLGYVIGQLHTGTLDPILSSFVDFADRLDATTLDRLDALVQQRKRARDQKP